MTADDYDPPAGDTFESMLGELSDVTYGAADPFAAMLGESATPSMPADDFDDLIEAAKPAAALGWMSLLHLSEEGAIKSTLHNLRLIVENDVWTRGVPAYNEFTQDLVQRGRPGHKRPRRKSAAKPVLQLDRASWKLRDPVNGDFWTEDKDNDIRALIEAPETQGGYGIKVSDRDLKAAIDIVGRDNAFHPVREYLTGLTWDGTQRVERLFVDYLGASNDVYHRASARIMMVAAVTRVFEPGAKFDFAVILEGLQGKRKSTFIKVLGRHWSAELTGNFNDRRAMVDQMLGKWVVELPELSGFAKQEVQEIKAFISTERDRTRLAYARRASEFPRQSVLIGSTNDSSYLRDPTGGRRFLPVACSVQTIDTARLERNIDQLWAEALHIYRAMRAEQPYGTLPLYLTDPAAQEIAEGLQESRRIETADDGMAGQIAAWLEKPISTGSLDEDTDPSGGPVFRNETCLMQIWCECLGNERKAYVGPMPIAVGRAMKLVPGWADHVGKQVTIPPYGPQRGYFRGGWAGKLARDGVKLP